jgi:RNA polymerase sigma factor (TIGR02999 family)
MLTLQDWAAEARTDGPRTISRMEDSDQVTALLSAWRDGDNGALERLIPIVYDELRRVAARYMRGEQAGHTLQATALVHEAYLRLAREQDRTWANRAHFFAVSAQIMRNLLLDHARAASRAKRGGGLADTALDEAPGLIATDPDELLALDEALRRLTEMDPRAARIVELRYFTGLSNAEVAAVLDTSEKTVKRDWSAAKAWLQAELRSQR